jgi:hypothetical protein
MAFNRGEDRVNVSGRTGFEVLAESLQTAADGTQSLRLTLRSRRDPVEIGLLWRLRPGLSPVEMRYTLTNRGEEPIEVFRLSPFSYLLQSQTAKLWYLQRDTTDPRRLSVQERTLCEGETETLHWGPGRPPGHPSSVPWFVLEREGDRGGVLVAWGHGGTGRFVVARAATTTIVTAGLRPDLFKHALAPGKTLRAPTAFLGTYAGRPDDAARQWREFLSRRRRRH